MQGLEMPVRPSQFCDWWSTRLKPNASVLLDALGKASFRFLAKLFDVSATTAYNWLRPAAESLGQPVREEKIKAIEMDQRWHFLRSKKTRDESSKSWSVLPGELRPGLWAVVMRPRQRNWTTSYHRRKSVSLTRMTGRITVRFGQQNGT